MEYRTLGRTDLRVSEIGLGCEGFAGQDDAFARALLDDAIAAGVNCMDLYSPDPALRSAVGRALAGRREQFVLQAHLCSVWQNGQYKASRRPAEFGPAFEDLLARLQTDFIDIGMIHYVDSVPLWDEVAQGDVMRYALAQKRAGRIRHIGLSSHNPDAALAAVESGLIDVLMFSINPCYDLQPAGEDVEKLWADESYAAALTNMDPAREKLYETCLERGVGITVMKAFGGGDLLNASLSPAGRALTAAQCLHYALTRPAVGCVMVGAHTREELQESLAYETASPAQRDYAAALAGFPSLHWRGRCMYCGHCAPCPAGIDVAAVTKFLNLARAQAAVPETVAGHYAALAHHANECIDCGQCEARCPFGVPVRANMADARRIFGVSEG